MNKGYDELMMKQKKEKTKNKFAKQEATELKLKDLIIITIIANTRYIKTKTRQSHYFLINYGLTV